ncbi:MAG: PaaX [Myxococcota bacterium]
MLLRLQAWFPRAGVAARRGLRYQRGLPDPFTIRLRARVTAKRAILSVLTATAVPLTTAQLQGCGALLGCEAPAIRVALGRLVDRGDVTALGDGCYEIGARGAPIATAVQRWVALPKRVKPWREGWLLVHTAHLGRRHRASLRRRERALSLFGFAALLDGLWVRPDNLTQPVDEIRRDLTGLGLEADAVLATASALDAGQTLDPHALWDAQTLEAGYSAALAAMQTCLAGFDDADVRARARDTARIGSAVIGMLIVDPLLPAALVDARLRRDVHRTMVTFDRVGKKALRAFWAATG